MKAIARLTLTCLLATLGTHLYAATYFVSNNGSDTNNGSEQMPWRTLRKGLTSLYPGDTLYVRGGLYQEVLGDSSSIKIRPATREAPILVKAYPHERPVLQGLLWLSQPSYWTIDGINVTWKDGISSRKHMVKMTNGVGWIFRNAEVWGAKSYAGILVAGTVPKEPSNWKITGCVIRDIYKSNDTNQDHCIYVHTGPTAGWGIIQRCILMNAVNGEGIKIGGSDPGEGSNKVVVRYNTIYNCVQPILVSWNTSNTQIYRNILVKAYGNYGAIRGYQLEGNNNIAFDNIAYMAKSMLLNDPGYPPIIDGGGNTLPLDPQFDSYSLTGFRPQCEEAKNYGRYAPFVPKP